MKCLKVLAALIVVIAAALPAFHATPAIAVPFTIGNTAPASTFFVQGQSFTPGVLGNLGSGSAPASGLVELTTFHIDYNLTFSSPLASLAIYAAAPTVTAASTGAGSLGIGTHTGGGTYSFANLALDVNTVYFAVLLGSASIFDGSGNTYTGDVDLFPQSGIVNLGGGAFDIGFSATFVTPVPAPGMIALMGLALIAIGWRQRPTSRP